MVGGFVCKKGKQEGCFWKKGCKGRGSLVIRGKVGGGVWAKSPSPFSPHVGKQGRGGASPAAPERRPWGSAVAMGRGKREIRPRGTHSPP